MQQGPDLPALTAMAAEAVYIFYSSVVCAEKTNRRGKKVKN